MRESINAIRERQDCRRKEAPLPSDAERLRLLRRLIAEGIPAKFPHPEFHADILLDMRREAERIEARITT